MGKWANGKMNVLMTEQETQLSKWHFITCVARKMFLPVTSDLGISFSAWCALDSAIKICIYSIVQMPRGEKRYHEVKYKWSRSLIWWQILTCLPRNSKQIWKTSKLKTAFKSCITEKRSFYLRKITWLLSEERISAPLLHFTWDVCLSNKVSVFQYSSQNEPFCCCCPLLL